MPGDDDPERSLFTTHPDLIDPEWQRKARKATRRQRRARDDYWSAEAGGNRPSNRPGGRTIITVVVAGLVVGSAAWLGLDNSSGQGGPSSQPQAAAATPPSVTATSRVSAPLDLNQPFADTPAAGWANGAAGIMPPLAAAVGGHSAAQVADLDNRVKQVLVAAHLDDRLLVNHDPAAYLGLLAPKAHGDSQRNLSDPQQADGGGEVTVLAAGYTLLPAPVKVDGTLSPGTDADGNLTVHANYVFAYPFRPPSSLAVTQSWEIVAVEHVQEDFTLINDTRRYTADSQGLFITKVQSYASSIACAPFKTGYLGPAYANPDVIGAPDTNNPDALYDPNHAMDVQNTCSS